MCIEDLFLRFIPTERKVIMTGRGDLEVLAECLLVGIIYIILKCFPFNIEIPYRWTFTQYGSHALTHVLHFLDVFWTVQSYKLRLHVCIYTRRQACQCHTVHIDDFPAAEDTLKNYFKKTNTKVSTLYIMLSKINPAKIKSWTWQQSTETFTFWAINPREDGQPMKVDGSGTQNMQKKKKTFSKFSRTILTQSCRSAIWQ